MAARNTKFQTEETRRAISEGMKRAYRRGRWRKPKVGKTKCENCGHTIKAYKGKRFCSARCAAQGTAKERSEKTRKMTDTERRIKAVLKRHIMRYRKRVTMRQLLAWLGCTLREFVAMMESWMSDGMTWDNYGIWQLDHKKARGEFENLMDDSQAAECFHHSNLQCLWRGDNQRKENERRRLAMAV